MGVRTKKLIIYIVVSTWNSSIAHNNKTVPYGQYDRGNGVRIDNRKDW